MIIITDCLTQKADEGCLKLANSLIKRLKAGCHDMKIISYKNQTEQSTLHMDLNKLFFNPGLFRVLRREKKQILYIPFASNTKASLVRTYFLSAFSGCQVFVLFALRHPMDKISKTLLHHSGAQIITLSGDSNRYFGEITGKPPVYLKAAVDTKKYLPVEQKQKKHLRRKYHIPEDAKVLLHVGHLNEGRNIQKLLNVPKEYHLLLVISTLNAQETTLRKQMEERPNTTIIDCYLENIEQIYQLSDVYLFPVQEEENCIDVPLSALEAAACNIPVVATPYGELKELLDKDGFYEIKSFEPEALNQLIQTAIEEKKEPRSAALPYDWDLAVDNLLKLICEK